VARKALRTVAAEHGVVFAEADTRAVAGARGRGAAALVDAELGRKIVGEAVANVGAEAVAVLVHSTVARLAFVGTLAVTTVPFTTKTRGTLTVESAGLEVQYGRDLL
jgi:hypothetical protein